jgi:hypothetical protein
LDKVHEFLASLAAFVESTIEEVNESERTQLLLDVGLVFVVACNRISDIAVNRGAVNERSPEQSLTPVLPHDLVKISAAEFLRKALKQVARLEHHYCTDHINVIADQHKALLRAYRVEPVLRSGIDASNGRTSFDCAWTTLIARFPDLAEFCGGNATVFPGTATVESDFSVLRWEKDAFRKSLSDFGLDGVLHTKHYLLLESLVV